MRKSKFLIIFLVIFAIFSQNVFAIDDEKPLSLDDCIELALKNSPYIKKQRINYQMSKNDVKLAQSVYFPTLSAGAGYNFSDRENSKTPSTNSNAMNVSASLKQLIWDFGKTNANIKMEKFYRIAAIYDFDTTVLDTIFDVKIKYYTILAAKAAIEVDRSNLLINERNYQRIDAYFTEGLKSKIDLVNAEVNVTQAKVSLIGAENLYKTSLSLLNNAMYLAGEPKYNIEVPENFKMVKDFTPKSLTENIRPVEDFIAPPKSIEDAKLTAQINTTDYASLYKFEKFPYSFEECLKIANEKRPDMKSLNEVHKAMEQYLLLVKRNYYPELSASGTYGFDFSKVKNTDSTNSNSFGVGVNLSSAVNIMNEKYKIDNAKLQLELAQNNIDLLKQDIYFEVQQAYIDMLEYEEKIPLLEQKIKQTLENLELADGRYSVGLGDYIELQDARMNYNTAQHSFVEAVYNYNLSKAKLEKVIALDQKTAIKLEDKI